MELAFVARFRSKSLWMKRHTGLHMASRSHRRRPRDVWKEKQVRSNPPLHVSGFGRRQVDTKSRSGALKTLRSNAELMACTMSLSCQSPRRGFALGCQECGA